MGTLVRLVELLVVGELELLLAVPIESTGLVALVGSAVLAATVQEALLDRISWP